MSNVVAAVADRARMTEGQLYSVVITLAAAVLLATGLGNVHGVVSAALAQPPLELAPVTQLPPVAVPTAVPPPVVALPGPTSLPPFDTGAEPFPRPEPAPPPVSEPTATPSPTPSPTPSAPPCTAQPVNDGAAQVIRLLDQSAGGQLPDEDLLAAIALVTGCTTVDPAVIAIGLLIGTGETLPALEGVEVPVVPVLTVPDPVVAALQPARPALDQVCGLVGTGQTVASLFITAYPRPVAQLTAQTLFQALSVCGQVRNP